MADVDSDMEYHTLNYSVMGRNTYGFERGLKNFTVLDVDLTDSNKESGIVYCPLTFRFIWYTVITGTLSLLGLAGNTLSVIILHRDKGNEVANLLLQVLALADNALLFTSIIVLSIMWGALLYFNATDAFETISPYFMKYVQPIGYMTKTCAIWMTVLLAVNRYIVIKKPLEAHRICTLWKARLQISVVVIFSVVWNLPRFFRMRIHDTVDGYSSSIPYEETSIGKGSLFHIIYTNVLYTLLVLILPLVLLVFLNVSLILELKKMRQERSLMNVNAQPSDANITLVMCIIIVIFIVCHTPDRILQGVNSFYKDDWWEHMCYLVAICNLLIVINSSSNFLVYYFVRKRFRRLLIQVLCPGYTRRTSEANTFVFQMEDETEANGPLSALRKLSRSVTELFFRQVNSNNANNVNTKGKGRTSSLGNLLNTNHPDKTIRSQSAVGLMDMTQRNTEDDN